MKRLILAAIGLTLWASAALAQDVCPPSKAAITVTTGKTTVVFNLTWPGDDCATGTATTYKILRKTSSFDDSNWGTATVAETGAVGYAGGVAGCVDAGGATCNTSYYWALLVIDDAGNKTLSNVVQKSTTACISAEQICP